MKKLFGILAFLFVMGILFTSCTKQEIVPVDEFSFEEFELRGDDGDDFEGEDPDSSLDSGEDVGEDDEDTITDDDDDEDEDDGGAIRNATGL